MYNLVHITAWTSIAGFTVFSLLETSRFLSNAIHCPIFHSIYLPPMFFLCLSFLLQQLTPGKVSLFTFFLQFWMCLVFKTHSVPTGNKVSCSKMGPQLTVCSKYCILDKKKGKQWNKTRQKNILPYVVKKQYKKQKKTTARQETLRLFMNSAV
jgi:hypothetical protein